jgi:FtsP/CotA-like multicopper oxidase with cupredoxin domain
MMAAPLDLELEMRLSPRLALAAEPATRSEMVMLMGGGPEYRWSLNGRSSHRDAIFTVRPGERVEAMLHNMTNMAHPMHLHGHHFQVVGIDNHRLAGALRDTILVPQGRAVTIAFDANNPGAWAFHCHHLYHMNAGMLAAISYRSAA